MSLPIRETYKTIDGVDVDIIAPAPTGSGGDLIQDNVKALADICEQLLAYIDDSDAGALLASLTAHIANVANPHSVTKAQVGLSNVTNNAQLPLIGGTMSGNIVMGGNALTNVYGITVANDGTINVPQGSISGNGGVNSSNIIGFDLIGARQFADNQNAIIFYVDAAGETYRTINFSCGLQLAGQTLVTNGGTIDCTGGSLIGVNTLTTGHYYEGGFLQTDTINNTNGTPVFDLSQDIYIGVSNILDMQGHEITNCPTIDSAQSTANSAYDLAGVADGEAYAAQQDVNGCRLITDYFYDGSLVPVFSGISGPSGFPPFLTNGIECGNDIFMNSHRIIGYQGTNYASNALAISGGLAVGTIYADASGNLKVVI